MVDQPKMKLPMEEWPEDKPAVPPTPQLIIQPFKDLMTFYPNDQADHETLQWIDPIEQRYLRPLGLGAARVFHVDLIDDDEYIEMPEEAKNTCLSCVLTRAEVRETQLGWFEWHPLLVVVKYCIYVAVQVRVERATGKLEIPRCMLWSQAQQQYVPIVDPKSTHIENPGILLQILDQYQRIEGLG